MRMVVAAVAATCAVALMGGGAVAAAVADPSASSTPSASPSVSPSSSPTGVVPVDPTDCTDFERYTEPTGAPSASPSASADDGNGTDGVYRRIRHIVSGLKGSANYGISDADRRVIVFWKAPVPQTVAGLPDRSWPNGITVEVVTTPYATKQLLAAEHRIVKVWQTFPHLTGIGPCPVGTGMAAGIAPKYFPKHRSGRAIMTRRLQRVARVPVFLERLSPAVAA